MLVEHLESHQHSSNSNSQVCWYWWNLCQKCWCFLMLDLMMDLMPVSLSQCHWSDSNGEECWCCWSLMRTEKPSVLLCCCCHCAPACSLGWFHCCVTNRTVASHCYTVANCLLHTTAMTAHCIVTSCSPPIRVKLSCAATMVLRLFHPLSSRGCTVVSTKREIWWIIIDIKYIFPAPQQHRIAALKKYCVWIDTDYYFGYYYICIQLLILF